MIHSAPNVLPLVRRSLAAKKAWRTRKLMALATGRDAKCSRCSGARDNLHDPYCFDCRATYMRLRRRVVERKPTRVVVLPPVSEWLPVRRAA